jgi:hypothetical protein
MEKRLLAAPPGSFVFYLDLLSADVLLGDFRLLHDLLALLLVRRVAI